MPLIPIPPIPTKWMRRPFLYTRRPLPDPRPPEGGPDDLLRSPGPAERRGGRGGGREPGRVVLPGGEHLQHPLRRRLLLLHPDAAPPRAEFLRVPLLVPVGGERVRHEDARLAEERRLRHR